MDWWGQISIHLCIWVSPGGFCRSAGESLHAKRVVLALFIKIINNEFEQTNSQVNKACWIQTILIARMDSYHQTCSSSNIADGIVMRAAAIMVFAAGGRFKRAASPGEAVAAVFIDTTARAALRAGVVVVANCWGLYWGRRRWGGFWWVLAFLYRIGCFHSNSTFACGCIDVTLHSHKTILPPVLSPGVLNNPVILSFISAIAHCCHTMI